MDGNAAGRRAKQIRVIPDYTYSIVQFRFRYIV